MKIHTDFASIENYLKKDIHTLETAGNKEKWGKKKKGELAIVVRAKQSVQGSSI